MSGRTAASSRQPLTAAVTLDLVLLTCQNRRLYVLGEASARRRVELPWGSPVKGEQLDDAAARIARQAIGAKADWIGQVGAFVDSSGHRSGSALSVCYLGVLPWKESPSWRESRSLMGFGELQRRMITAGLEALRARLEHTPIAFSLLPRFFTLSDLQQTYETVLARRLHKASFRRSLQAALLVEPTGEWRGEGRGRPAQLYRYAPRRRKPSRRGVRLDLF